LLTDKNSKSIKSFNLSGTKVYNVRSFFTALHLILTNILPPDRQLREYIHIFILLTALLRRLFRHYKSLRSNIRMPTKSSLLVVLLSSDSSSQRFRSRSTIRFSATGSAKTKNCLRNKLINDRIHNLPELTKITKKKKSPSPGNCAEAETLGHLDSFVSSVRGTAGKSRVVLGITSTIHFFDGTPDPNCFQCVELLRLLRAKDPLLRTLDLAPKQEWLSSQELHIS
jgi:hypothetical protein